MGIAAIDHANIRTADVMGTVAFFRDVLGMAATLAPGSADLANGAWMLDDAGRAAIHIGPLSAVYPTDGWRPAVTEARADTGRLHHVALNCTGYDQLRGRLLESGTQVAMNDIAEIGLRQLFVTDANGVLLELNFRLD